MENINQKLLKRSRIMYIAEAALEYLISILVTGSFLATVTKELGISDGLTGILSSVISLGVLVSAFIDIGKKKKGERLCYDLKHFKSSFLYASLCNTSYRNEKAKWYCTVYGADMRGLSDL